MRSEIAGCLEALAREDRWNRALWQRCHDLVQANWDNELLAYVYDDIVHYFGLFRSQNFLGLRVEPDHDGLEQYRQEFRDIAAALRSHMSFSEAQEKCGL